MTAKRRSSANTAAASHHIIHLHGGPLSVKWHPSEKQDCYWLEFHFGQSHVCGDFIHSGIEVAVCLDGTLRQSEHLLAIGTQIMNLADAIENDFAEEFAQVVAEDCSAFEDTFPSSDDCFATE